MIYTLNILFYLCNFIPLYKGNVANRTNGCRDKAKSEGGNCQYPWTQECPSDGPSSDEWFCKAVIYNDDFTQEIGRGFIAEFQSLTGKTPYLIIDNLHRSKMDPNRPINRAAQVCKAHIFLEDPKI